MEVKHGYKYTDVGVIPEEWDVGILGDHTDKVGSGITPTGGERVYKSEGRPFIRSQNIGWGTLFLSDVAFIDEATHMTFAETEIKVEDVFLNITGASIGRSAIADSRIQGGNVNQHVCIIRANQSKLIPQYLNYFLLSSAGQRQIDSFQSGGNRQGLNFRQVRSIQLPLPKPPEQHAIAQTLSDVDEMLDGLDQLISKKRNLKQATLQQLLNGQTRLLGFCGEWETKLLPQVCLFRGGKAHEQHISEFGQYVCVNSKFISTEGKERKYSTANFCCAKKNDILMVMSDLPNGRALAKAFLADRDNLYAVNQRVCCLTAYRDCPQFLFYILNRNPYFLRFDDGVSQTHLLNHVFQKCPIRLPATVAEQIAIAEVLTDMDAELAVLDQQQEKLNAMKQAIMQELLAGTIRLI